MQIRFTDKKKKRREKNPCAKYKRHKNEQNPKSAESVNASVATSGSACDLASLGFGFSFFRVFSFSRRAERSDADLYQDK
ncbi:MAG: hypothetical protein U0M06_09815, partial [Clostridia bacterium]|nr:hypothetical protein [Clostridia bacterium]